MNGKKQLWSVAEGEDPECPVEKTVAVVETFPNILQINIRMELYQDSISIHSGYLYREQVTALRDALTAWLEQETTP